MESKKSKVTKQNSFSAERRAIEKLFPDLKIIDAAEEMLGKTSVITQTKPSEKSKEE